MKTIENDVLVLKTGSLIKKIRNEKGISQRVIRYELGINICRIERGCVKVNLCTLNSLCQCFETDIAEFFNRLKCEINSEL